MAKRLKVLRTKVDIAKSKNGEKIENKNNALSLFAEEIGQRKNYFSIFLLKAPGNVILSITSSMKNFGDKKREILKTIILTGECTSIIAFSNVKEDIKSMTFKKEIREIGSLLEVPTVDVISPHDCDSYQKGIFEDKAKFKRSENKVKKVSEKEDMGNVFVETEKYFSMRERSVKDAILSIAEDIKNLDREVLYLISLDKNEKPINACLVSMGAVNWAPGFACNIFKVPILTNAEKIILMHNHPSGNPTPSEADIRFTIKISKIAQELGIKLYDHYIVGSCIECIFERNIVSIKGKIKEGGYTFEGAEKNEVKERIKKMKNKVEEWIQKKKEEMKEAAKKENENTPKKKEERVYINLPKAFCKQMDSKLREGEKFNTMIMPQGVKLNGKDIGGCLINPIYMNENPYNKNEMSATYYPAGIKNEGIKLTHPDGRKEFIDIEELRDAIIEHQKEYRASLEKKNGKEIESKEMDQEKEL